MTNKTDRKKQILDLFDRVDLSSHKVGFPARKSRYAQALIDSGLIADEKEKLEEKSLSDLIFIMLLKAFPKMNKELLLTVSNGIAWQIFAKFKVPQEPSREANGFDEDGNPICYGYSGGESNQEPSGDVSVEYARKLKSAIKYVLQTIDYEHMTTGEIAEHILERCSLLPKRLDKDEVLRRFREKFFVDSGSISVEDVVEIESWLSSILGGGE